MCSLKITPCICYLSDKNLEEQEYLKLFTLYGAIFDATPETISSFTAYAAEQHRLSPRTFQADEIFQIRNQVIRPHAKRVNPYGCYDITRYGAFFNVNVPKEICYSCPYSVSYKNARKETEDLLIAAILHTGNIPDKIKLQMELSNNKAADTIMTSVLAVQGKEKHKGKFDMIRLNSFLLQYLQTDSHLICTENADRISGKIKDSLKTSLLKESETSNTHDYVYETLCKELARITHIDTASSGDEKTLEDIALTLTSPYKYDRNDAVNTIKYSLSQPTDNTVPFLIEPVELPTVSDHVSIIDTAPILPKSAPKSSHNEPTHKTANHTDCHKHHENTVMTDINSKDIPRDPECYYPDNYEIDRSFAEKNVTLIGDIAHLPDLYDGAAPEPGNMVMAHFPEFPFLAETNASYVIAMEKSSLCGVEGLFLYAGGTYYFYILHGSDNKTLKKLLRHRPLIITLNSVELYAALREHRIYEGRITDLKDLYATAAAQDTIPHTYQLLMEKMTGRDFSECADLYPQAVRYYADVYKVYSEKISDPAESEILEQYTAVSMSVGCSWHTQDTFAGFSSLYKRKNLFEYQSLCPEKLTPKVPGSFYMYHTDDIPAKNEKFYSGLILELVRKESIKLGKILILKISDKGLYLFAFETCGLTYEMLQWPCVYLARKLGIKNSLIHYSRKIHTL